MIYRLPDKQPSETMKGLWVDFAGKLLAGETISTATVTGSVAGVVQNKQTNGTIVTWDATAGTSGVRVDFVVMVTGSLGSIREANLFTMIKDVI